MTYRNDGYYNEAENAKVYIGSNLCGALPGTLERGKVYSFSCEVVGDFVKLVTGNSRRELSFAQVEVYTKSNENNIK